MKINFAGLAICAVLVGCGDGAPFNDPFNPRGGGTTGGGGGTTGGGTTGGGSGISVDGVPPGTAAPSPDTSIFRSEAPGDDAATDGNGFAEGIAYNSADDTFTVDNLPFDGSDNVPYQRGTSVGTLNSFAVYEAVAQYPDSVTTDPIRQLTHRAIYGQSRNLAANGAPATQFAIVRTGAYVDYGFGGFIYQRDSDVTLPTSGQALYNGRGAGLRDFSGNGGFEYSTSSVQIAIDFDDFNANNSNSAGAVDGSIFNRRIYNASGTEITNQVVSRLNAENNANLSAIPNAVFTIQSGVLDNNGEIIGELNSAFTDNNGNRVQYEEGNYYAIVAGDGTAGTDEVTGIVVLETSVDPIADTVRDTTGFIVYRGDPVAP